jgi:predicted nuclease of predicted toxin-antitoxin system
MLKFYTNENFPLPTVLLLRGYGYDVLTTQDTGNSNLSISDEDVLFFSTEQKRVLITLNRRDFIKLHQSINNHFGIIICTEDTDFKALATRIHKEINITESFENQLIRVYKTQN